MKNFCISLFCLSIIILTFVLGFNTPKAVDGYLRLHVRANSNLPEDQSVKYLVKDEIVVYLTPIVAEQESLEDIKKALKSHINDIESVANRALSRAGKDYRATAEITVEEFPTRIYDGLTLEQGYYDALIVRLGEGCGDNWWCVVYPPLCFLGDDTGGGFRYKSKIAEIISGWRARYGK